jgi:hypothetical protein
MNENHPENELIRLWLLANEGLASDEELQRLNSWLEEDADARKSLIHLTGQQGWLIWNGARAPGMALAAIGTCNSEDTEDEAVGVEAAAVERAANGSQLRPFGTRLQRIVERGRSGIDRLHGVRIPLVSYRMAALAACIALVASWFAIDYKKLPFAGGEQASSDVRAEMIGATVCVWSGGVDGTPALGHQFHEGDTLQLLEGVAELRIASATSGAELQLEGPVAVVIGANGISNLRYGKVAIQTSHVGAGFQVATSFGRVVAGPGAEIGITTFGNTAEVHVFDGIVALESPWIVSEDGELAKRHLQAGEAVRLNQTGEGSLLVASIPPDHGLFTTRLTMDANFLSVSPNYVRAIQDAKPVCYWRFESVEGNRVHN